jgi:putative addiction module component (TIGR02574 family)
MYTVYTEGLKLTVTIQSLGIDQLTVQERLELIEQIWDSLPTQVQAEEIPAWHREEITKRRAILEATNAVGRPWREVLAKDEGGA